MLEIVQNERHLFAKMCHIVNLLFLYYVIYLERILSLQVCVSISMLKNGQ